MYVYLNPTTTAVPAPRIVMESVVILDPWPFADDSVEIAHEDHYWLDAGGQLNLRFAGRTASALYKSHPDFLARATDGKLVLGSLDALKKYEERVR